MDARDGDPRCRSCACAWRARRASQARACPLRARGKGQLGERRTKAREKGRTLPLLEHLGFEARPRPMPPEHLPRHALGLGGVLGDLQASKETQLPACVESLSGREGRTSPRARSRSRAGSRRMLWLAARRRRCRGSDWKARCVPASLQADERSRVSLTAGERERSEARTHLADFMARFMAVISNTRACRAWHRSARGQAL